MRRLTCDQWEFEPSDSEQMLELAISSPSKKCPDLHTLLATCGASAKDGSPPPIAWDRWDEIVKNLDRFLGMPLPHPTQMRAVVLLRDTWDELELGFAYDSVLMWYYWSTSA